MKIKDLLKKHYKENSGYLVLSNSELHKKVINEMIKPFKNKRFTKVMAAEMKGLLYGPTIAYKLNLPFVPILKDGRVPKDVVISRRFKDYSKKTKSLQVGKITVGKGDRILLVDDIYETGETGKNVIEMIEELGGSVEGISVVYNKFSKKDEDYFKRYNFHYLVKQR